PSRNLLLKHSEPASAGRLPVSTTRTAKVWNNAYIPLRAERDYRETTTRAEIRFVICPASPRAPSGLIYFTRKRSSAAENSPIRNKLVGRQLTGGDSDRSPPRCVGTSDAPLPSRKQDDFGSRWPIGNKKRACFRPAPGSSAIWKWDPTRGSGRYTALPESGWHRT